MSPLLPVAHRSPPPPPIPPPYHAIHYHPHTLNHHTPAARAASTDPRRAFNSQHTDEPGYGAIREHTLNWVAGRDIFDDDSKQNLVWLAREEMRHLGLKDDPTHGVLREYLRVLTNEAVRRHHLKLYQFNYAAASRIVRPLNLVTQTWEPQVQAYQNHTVQEDASQVGVTKCDSIPPQPVIYQAAQSPLAHAPADHGATHSDQKELEWLAFGQVEQGRVSQGDAAKAQRGQAGSVQDSASSKEQRGPEESDQDSAGSVSWEVLGTSDIGIDLEDEYEDEFVGVGNWCLVDKPFGS
jgi:hypothetical protein